MSNPMLPLHEMERIIDRGGSILHAGQLIVDKDSLPRPEVRARPTPDELAAMPADERHAYRKSLMVELAGLNADLMALGA